MEGTKGFLEAEPALLAEIGDKLAYGRKGESVLILGSVTVILYSLRVQHTTISTVGSYLFTCTHANSVICTDVDELGKVRSDTL